MSEKKTQVSIYCGDHTKVVVDLSTTTELQRKSFLLAYVDISETTVLDTSPKARDGGSIEYGRVVRLDIPVENQEGQITKMQTVTKLLELFGMEPHINLNAKFAV